MYFNSLPLQIKPIFSLHNHCMCHCLLLSYSGVQTFLYIDCKYINVGYSSKCWNTDLNSLFVRLIQLPLPVSFLSVSLILGPNPWRDSCFRSSRYPSLKALFDYIYCMSLFKWQSNQTSLKILFDMPLYVEIKINEYCSSFGSQ